ncbi:MAG: hypothetical protein B6U69_01325 [Thermofilum sp. ex4484_15]|nr:MAG: hypothetical protein B6U69_01325 [Thermofilum sp. ex4484_15]
MGRYEFKPFFNPVLSEWVVTDILNGLKNGLSSLTISLDLGISRAELKLSGGKVRIGDLTLSAADLKRALKLARNGALIELAEGKLVKLAFYSNGKYYKLKAIAPYEAPTLEINGIHMHRIEGITPLLEIARHNPWSRDLSKVEILLGDATEVVRELEDDCFEAVLLDPPRYSLAPELYASSFYRELFRVLKPGGKLFHYTGEPGSRSRGIDLAGSVLKRLKGVGFRARRVSELRGVIAMKGR